MVCARCFGLAPSFFRTAPPEKTPCAFARAPARGAPAAEGPADTGAADKPHYLGHRERLRARLLAGGAEALADYELLEFVLFAARLRGDTKPLAKALIARFGGFAGVFGADKEALMDVPGMREATPATLLAVRAAALRIARAEVQRRSVIGSWQALLDYCTIAAGYAPVEEFRLLFLAQKNAPIAH